MGLHDAGAATLSTGKFSTESPPPAHPMKISFQSSVSKFSIVLPAHKVHVFLPHDCDETSRCLALQRGETKFLKSCISDMQELTCMALVGFKYLTW